MSRKLSSGSTRLSSKFSKMGMTSNQQRPWWQTPYITYSFTHPRVRSRIEKLTGGNVVRATDRKYMKNLQSLMKMDHANTVSKRIQDREVQEVEREKRLILEGKLAMEEAPAELADHPVFKINKLTKMILEERRLKAEAQQIHRKIKGFDYDLLKDLISENDKEDKSEIEVAIALNRAEQKKELQMMEIEEDIEGGVVFTEADSDRIKYEDPLVKELRTIEILDEMYPVADTIIGPITTRCVVIEDKVE